MKRALYIAGPIGLTLIVVGAGWAALAPRSVPLVYRITLVAGLVLVLLGAWGRRDVLLAQGGVRKARLGAGALASAGLTLAIVLLINFAGARYQQRWDVTRAHEFSLHPATVRALRTLTVDVDVYAFIPSTDQRRTRAVRSLYETFAYRQPTIHHPVADPNKRPDLLEKLQIRGSNITVAVAGDHKTAFSNPDDADRLQGALAGALLEVARDKPRVVYWVVGHGERDIDGKGGLGFVQFQQELRKSYFQVRTLSLGAGEQVPEDASLLVFADPRRTLPDNEATLYNAWLRQGNRALVLQDVDFGQAEGQNGPMAPLLDQWGLHPVPAVILDPRARTGETDPRIAVADQFGRDRESPVGSLLGQRAIFPIARPIESTGLVKADQQIFFRRLVSVGPDGTGKGNDPFATFDVASTKDVPKVDAKMREAWSGRPLDIAIAAFRDFPGRRGEAGREARLVVVGDADFLTDQHIDREANHELAVDLVRWLTGEELLIRRAGEAGGRKAAVMIEPAQSSLATALAVVVPAFVWLVGWVVWFARRSK